MNPWVLVAAEVVMISLALLVLALTLVGARGHWSSKDWVIWCEVILLGVLCASPLARYLDPSPTTTEDLIRIFALRPGLVLVMFILYYHAGRRRRESRLPDPPAQHRERTAI